MRFDRFITLQLVHPLRRMLSRNPEPSTLTPFPVPILMYHNISDDPEPGVSPYYQTNTSPAVFRRHMQFLADHAYQTVTLDQIITALHHPTTPDGAEVPATPVSAF